MTGRTQAAMRALLDFIDERYNQVCFYLIVLR